MAAKGILVASMLLGATVATGSAMAETQLDSDAIRKLVTGRSASWVSAEGRSGVITYHPDGKLSAKVKLMGAMMPIGGTWEIKDGKFCRTIRMDTTPTRCQSVMLVSGRTYKFYNADGKLATTTTFN